MIKGVAIFMYLILYQHVTPQPFQLDGDTSVLFSFLAYAN